MDTYTHALIRETGVILGVTALVLFLGVVLWYAADLFLLVFAGALLAVFLRGLSDGLSQYTALSDSGSLALVVLALLAVFGVGVWLLAPEVSVQLDQLIEQLPRSVKQIKILIGHYEWGRHLVANMPNAGEMIPDQLQGQGLGNVLGKVAGLFSMTFGAIAGLLLFLFIGLFFAAELSLYVNGLIRLVPIARRVRARAVLDAIGHALRWWLIGRVFSMAVVALATALGLQLLGIPLAITLGLIAGLLGFVPGIGPILATVPAALVALLQSPLQVLYVVVLYVAGQLVEGYLLMPLVQRYTVALPPVLTVVGVVLLTVLLGGLGLVLAAPLTVVVFILVKMLYIEDMLGDVMEAPAEQYNSSVATPYPSGVFRPRRTLSS
jgi:predicted PurR-regulated permease PerM